MRRICKRGPTSASAQASHAAAPAPATASPLPPPRPPPHPLSSSRAPPFGRLLLAALHTLGIEYISLDHLRRAKKHNALDEREYLLLWKLLHDLVLAVLLDFQIDASAMKQANAPENLHNALVDTSEQGHWKELVRFYLFEWGFVCHALYVDSQQPAASVLLLALAWLLAHSQLVARQRDAILALYLSSPPSSAEMPKLPPYPDDVSLSRAAVARAASCATTSDSQQQVLISESATSEWFRGALQQLQWLVGRIHTHERARQCYQRYYDRMRQRADDAQRQPGAIRQDEEGEGRVPAYALQVLAHESPHMLERHLVAINERIQMDQDEQLFYKWINSLLLQYPSPPPPATPATEPMDLIVDDQGIDSDFLDLQDELSATQRLFQQNAPLFQQISALYTTEMQKWQGKPKTRTQQTKMEHKMDKLRDEISVNELFDTQTLFLERKTKKKSPLAEEKEHTEVETSSAELDKLQQQLQHVMQEITSQYCRLELI